MRRACVSMAVVTGAVCAVASLGATVGVVWAQDATKLAPEMYHVVFENQRYRVIDYAIV